MRRKLPKSACCESEVLPKSTRELARKIQSDPKLAAAFLQKAGIVTKSGKLTANYR